MKIHERILTNNDCYRSGRKINVQGLMLHSVGVPQPHAEVFVNNWNQPVGACVHAFIDGISGDVYQTLPWDHRAWHCGDQANNTHIGVEMCEPDCIRYENGSRIICDNYPRAVTIVERTYWSAVDLFTMLCKRYNLDPMTDIISHREGYLAGVASPHDDPEHLWEQLGTGFTMIRFRTDVAAKMGVQDFKVLVTTPTLNIRSGAGLENPIVGQVYQNEVFTITRVVNDWGKLKSGAGWIYLKGYTENL